jgi:hypothetical protein
MTWNLRLVDMSTPNYKSVEIRKVHYEILGNPMLHTLATYDIKDQAEVDRYNAMVEEALLKPVLKFAS